MKTIHFLFKYLCCSVQEIPIIFFFCSHDDEKKKQDSQTQKA